MPYIHAELTRILVQPVSDKNIYFCPPQYHDKNTLVYRIYAHDLLPKLEGLGFSVGYVCQVLLRWGIPRMDMLVCRKDAALEDDGRHLIRLDQAVAPLMTARGHLGLTFEVAIPERKHRCGTTCIRH